MYAIRSYYEYQTQKIMKDIMGGTDRLSNTIILGAHYAMMLNSREDINHIINNVSKQKEIDTIRIYNKKGQIKFSNRPLELDLMTNIKAEACDVCHRKDPRITSYNVCYTKLLRGSSHSNECGR